MKKEKRGYWKSLSHYSKGTAIGLGFGLIVSVLLALFSYYDCSSWKCIAGNIFFYSLTFLFAGFAIGFIAGFVAHWIKYKQMYKVYAWEKTGILFLLINLLLFF